MCEPNTVAVLVSSTGVGVLGTVYNVGLLDET